MSVKIDLKIFLLAIIFYFTKQIELYAIIMIFAFIHELGHMICGIVLGFKPQSIKVTPFGFQICFKINHKENRHLSKIAIAFAGPAINILIALICIIISYIYICKIPIIIYANLLLAIFNLLPIYPLDGGRILQEIIHIKKGREKTYKITNLVSKATVIILTIATSIIILYIHNLAFLVILSYLWYLVIKNEQNYRIKKKLYKLIS